MPYAEIRGRFRPAKAVGTCCTLVGVAILAWLAVMIYRGSEADQVWLAALGIPLTMLIAWIGLFLIFRGLGWVVARRR